MNEIDPRLVQLGIEVNGRLRNYTGLYINASGIKFANPNQNEAEIQISNLDKATRDYILTETSPFNNNSSPKLCILSAGRQSYGLAEIYRGNIATVRVSQPPDVTITLRCLTGDFSKTEVLTKMGAERELLSNIARDVANTLGLSLNFQATDKLISNYSFSGSALRQVDRLAELSDISCYVDDNTLVVTQLNRPLSNVTKIISKDTGMVGIPIITEQGVTVRYLLDNTTKVGGLLRVSSEIYPIVNGDYIIYKLAFEITNREMPFYYVAEGKRII